MEAWIIQWKPFFFSDIQGFGCRGLWNSRVVSSVSGGFRVFTVVEFLGLRLRRTDSSISRNVILRPQAKNGSGVSSIEPLCLESLTLDMSWGVGVRGLRVWGGHNHDHFLGYPKDEGPYS